MMKYKLLLTLCATSLAWTAIARGEGRCPPGMYPIHSPGVAACAPIPQTQSVVTHHAPRYKDQWGAIARGKSTNSSQYGASAGFASRAGAEKAAVKDCEAGPEKCGVWFYYSNQCAAMATAAEGRL